VNTVNTFEFDERRGTLDQLSDYQLLSYVKKDDVYRIRLAQDMDQKGGGCSFEHDV
jgi:hypothetical protein